MNVRGTAVDIIAGLIGGIVATKVNDYVEKALWEATPESEKSREPDMEASSSAESAARMLLDHTKDAPPPEEILESTKNGIHFALGAGWGPLYCWLRRHTSMSPTLAGVTSGTALSLVVDETLNPLLGITPPPEAYPKSAHLRGLATHVVWGLVCGATAETLRKRWR